MAKFSRHFSTIPENTHHFCAQAEPRSVFVCTRHFDPAQPPKMDDAELAHLSMRRCTKWRAADCMACVHCILE